MPQAAGDMPGIIKVHAFACPTCGNKAWWMVDSGSRRARLSTDTQLDAKQIGRLLALRTLGMGVISTIGSVGLLLALPWNPRPAKDLAIEPGDMVCTRCGHRAEV